MNILKLTPSCKDYLWGGSRLRTDFGKDVFRAMALLWPDVPEQIEELCDYWYGERGEKILSGGGGS